MCQLEGSECQLEGSEGQLEVSEGQLEVSGGQLEVSEGLVERSNAQERQIKRICLSVWVRIDQMYIEMLCIAKQNAEGQRGQEWSLQAEEVIQS